MKVFKDLYGDDQMNWYYHPYNHVSNLDKNGNKLIDKNGKLMKREWQEYHPIHPKGLGIAKRREIYDHFIKKYNFPKLDRVMKWNPNHQLSN